MFESLTERLKTALRAFTSRGQLNEKNIAEGLREVRAALLEADVNYKVARDFIERVQQRAVGQEVIRSVTPGQQIVKIVYDELTQLMGPVDPTIPTNDNRPTVIMLCGLQGHGKTTTAGKLALYLRKKGRKPLLVAADLQRPAAVDQLEQVGAQAGIPVFTDRTASPPRVCKKSLRYAEENNLNTVILDTAGRLHVDHAMMAEVREIAERVEPDQILLVCNAQTGQDAVTSAAEFNRQLELDGIILTMLDGDARGGAALSVKAITGKPIKFVGLGEKLDALEEFRPERMADRILGMGDVRTLVEKAQETIDRDQAIDFQKKLRDASFTLEDFVRQLEQVRKMGPIKSLLKMLPFGDKLGGMEEVDEKDFDQIQAIIYSMTPQERAHPDVIDHSRRRRIAAGSGTQPHDVNGLLKQFRQMQKMMKQMRRRGRGMLGFGG
ncbi:MAG TPA: signal recognition particle protein [Planctomycetota bacterium]|nr:signal recognition particle protein [Planctomycetota bacterium]HRR79833.1 signal recognition particle protein [Planctomycetota bacterium]HRT92909.1 signal recognition particle protein [Planctomycetota bacterium]